MLKAISRSTFDLQTVLKPLLNRLLVSATPITHATHEDDGAFYRAASYGYRANSEFMHDIPVGGSDPVPGARCRRPGRSNPRRKSDPEYTWSRGQRLAISEQSLGVPMLREGFQSAY